jgi:flavin-dependent dehydrogenase
MPSIGIAGLGPAGAYLGALLQDKAEIFEAQKEERFTSVCAWGTGYYRMKDLIKQTGLNFDEYILHKGKKILVGWKGKLIEFDAYGLSTFDKPRLLKDLSKNTRVHFGFRVDRGYLESRYILAVDATGPNRTLLGKPSKDFLVPTIEYKVKFENPPFDDFYIEPFSGYSGYLWYFPLSEKEYFVGAGDVYLNHEERVLEFIKKHGGKIVEGSRKGKAIRLLPTEYMEPLYHMNAVAIGEAAGAVYPLLGEGILPSMISAKILYDNELNVRKYIVNLKNYFLPYKKAYDYLVKKMKGQGNALSDAISVFSIVRDAIKFKDVLGVDLKISYIFKILSIL